MERDLRSVRLPADVAVAGLQALYHHHASALGTTAGLMMSGDEAMENYEWALLARQSLSDLGIELPDPASDPWIHQIVNRAKAAIYDGYGDEHPVVSPGGPLP